MGWGGSNPQGDSAMFGSGDGQLTITEFEQMFKDPDMQVTGELNEPPQKKAGESWESFNVGCLPQVWRVLFFFFRKNGREMTKGYVFSFNGCVCVGGGKYLQIISC